MAQDNLELTPSHGQIVDMYWTINQNIGNNVLTLALTLIGTVWIIVENSYVNIPWLVTTTFLSCVISIVLRLVSQILGSRHLKKYFTGDLNKENIGSQNTWQGRWNKRLLWCAVGFVLLATIGFVLLVKEVLLK